MLPHIVKYNPLRIVMLIAAFCLLHTTGKAQSVFYVNTLAELNSALTGTSSAREGDTIQIGPGTIGPITATYTISAGITIQGSVNSDGTPATTLITSSARMFNITTSAGAGVVTIENLVITAQSQAGNPGAGFINATGANTNIVVDNVVASGFRATQGNNAGGVIAVGAGAQMIVRNSMFNDNQGRHGGVFGVTGATTYLEVENSRMYENSATNGDGAVFHITAGTVLVINSHIYDNTLPPARQGGTAYLTGGATMTVHRTYIVGNTTTHGGAGFLLDRGCNTLNLSFVSIVGNNNFGQAAGAIGAGVCDTINITHSLITGNLTTGGNFGNDLTPGAGINIAIDSSIVGEDYFINNDSVIHGVISPGDVVVGEDGHVIVNLQDYIIDEGGNIIEIPYPRDEDYNINIGAGGSGKTQIISISVVLTVSDSVPCVDASVTFTVEMRNIQYVKLASENIEYRLYLMVGSSRVLIESKTTNTITGTTFTINRPNVALERFRVTAEYTINAVDIIGRITPEQKNQISNEQILMVVPPLEISGIDHSRNTP